MTTVLQELSLNAYRGVSGVVLENLTPVSLVVGANNSGKSSILEAAGLMLRPPDPGQWVSAVRRRDADLALVDGIWSMFPGAEAVHPEDGPQRSSAIQLSATLGDRDRTVFATAQASEVTGVTDGGELAVRVYVSVNGDPAIELRFPGIKPVVHQVPVYRVFTVTPSSHYSTSLFVDQLSQVVDAGRKQLAVQLMGVFDSEVKDLDVIKSHGREAVRVTHASRGVVDLSSFGDGLRRAAALALTLTRASQGVLLIDEIESGIHHSVLRLVLGRLLKAAAAAQVQILATTHSLEAVDAIIGSIEDLGTSDSLSAFWVRRQDGKHEARRYDFAKICTLREGGLDIR
ncbi:MAG: AAA family ATPase [Planctomycetes bacterium]|nr:AAA family ATPase [Planctomycetota bacterium]